MPIESFDELKLLFAGLGVNTVYAKRLARKQDNQKNQIVLSSGLKGLSSAFAAKVTARAPSASELKRKSDAGQPILEAALDFYWVSPEGEAFKAPDTKIIDYFQYPEARLSGFLKNCRWGPRAIRREFQAEYGARILCIGTNSAGSVFGILLTEKDDPLASVFPVLPTSSISSLLGVFTTTTSGVESPVELVKKKITEAVNLGWMPSVRNKGGEIVAFSGNQGAGFTLEAFLGVESNSRKEPDYLGHEVKSFRGGKISLMTPTADGGLEGDLSFNDFMLGYGTPGVKNDGSLRFTGVARSDRTKRVGSSGRALRVAGFDAVTNSFATNPEDIRVEHYVAENGQIVSSWSFEKLAEGWNTKHAFAVYVRAEEQRDRAGTEYRYLSPFYMCEGTDVFMLLRAISAGVVYYDPAHVIYSDGKAKVRPQWRMSSPKNGFDDVLRKLYKAVNVIEV